MEIPKVSVYHDSDSHDNDYLNFFEYYDANMTLDKKRRDSILRQLFPHKKPNSVTQEEKDALAYNLTILVKAFIDNYGHVDNVLLPLRTKDEDMHDVVSDEEEHLVLLIKEYYQKMIDKVRGCESEIDVMPLFPETQNFQMLIDYLLEQNVNEKLINTIVEPIINVIQVE